MRISNEVLNQKLDDLIDYVRRIDAKVSETNGKVAEAHIKIAQLETQTKTCPARIAVDKDTSSGWAKFTITTAVSVLSLIVSLGAILTMIFIAL